MGKFADKVADRLGDHPVGSHLRGKKWAEIIGSALLALGVLALVTVWAAATAGYEATSRFSPNYNLTDNDHWFSKFIPGRTGNLCQPAFITVGQQFRTTNGVFLWEMGKQFNVTMSEVGNNDTMVNFNGTGQQYADNRLEHCDVSGVAVDMDLWQAQVRVKVYATCIDPEWPALLLSQNTYSVDRSRMLDQSLWFTNDLVMKQETTDANDLQTPLNSLAADLWYRQRSTYLNDEMPTIRGIRMTNNNNCGFATEDRKGCYESPVTWSNDSVGFYMYQNLTLQTDLYQPETWGIPTSNFIQSLVAAVRYDFAANMTNNIFVNSTARASVITSAEDPALNITSGTTVIQTVNALNGASAFLSGPDFDPPKISRVRTSYMCIVSKMKPPADFAISVLGLAFALFGVVFGVVVMIIAKLTGKHFGANPVVAAGAPGVALTQVMTNLTHRESQENPDDDEARAGYEKGHNRTRSDVTGNGTGANSHAHKYSDGSGGTAVPQYDSRVVTPAPSYNHLGRHPSGVQYTPLKNEQSFDHMSDGTPSPSTTKAGMSSFGSLSKFNDHLQMPGSGAAAAGSQPASGSGSGSGFGGAGLAAAGGGLLGLAGGFLGSKLGLSNSASGSNLQDMTRKIPGASNLQGMTGSIPGVSNLQGMAGNVPGVSNLQGMASNISGASNLQGMASGLPGASNAGGAAGAGAGGAASSIPGMPNFSNFASNIPGASNLQSMAGNIPGASNLQSMAGNIPGASNLQGIAGNIPGASALGNAQNLAAGSVNTASSGLSGVMPAAAAGLVGAGAGALGASALASRQHPATGDSALYMKTPSTIREVAKEGSALPDAPAAAHTGTAGAQVYRTPSQTSGLFRAPSGSSLRRANAPTSIDLAGTQPTARAMSATHGLPTSPGAPVRGVPTSPGPPVRGIPTSPGAPQSTPLDQTLASAPTQNAPSNDTPSIPTGAKVAGGAAVGLAGGALAGYAANAASAPKAEDPRPQARDFINATPSAVPIGTPQNILNEQQQDVFSSTLQGGRAQLNAAAEHGGNAVSGARQSAAGFIQPAGAAAAGAVAAGGAAVAGSSMLNRTPHSGTTAGPPANWDNTPRSPTTAGPPSGWNTPTASTALLGDAAASYSTPHAATAAGPPRTDGTPMSPTAAGPPAGWHK